MDQATCKYAKTQIPNNAPKGQIMPLYKANHLNGAEKNTKKPSIQAAEEKAA